MKALLSRFWYFSKRVVFSSAAICVFLLLGFWIRIQGVEQIPAGQFSGNDPYLYAKQAEQISELGILPAKDMERWLPLGRDNRQLCSLYAYVLAYSHKVFNWFFPKLTLYHIQLYSPTVFFTLGLAVLSIFLVRTHGIAFASIVTMLLATMPGSISRSMVGFSDRDAWIWFIAVLAVIFYLWKERMEPGYRRYVITALSGFTVFLGGLSWEAFGLFVSIILCVELWKFCSTSTEQNLKEYILWVFMFVPWLIIISPAYRSGYGYTTHVAALMIFPVLSILLMRGTRHVLLSGFVWCRKYPRFLSLMLVLIAMGIGIGYVISQAYTFELTAYPLQKSRLMLHVSELTPPDLFIWLNRYGGILVLGGLGLAVAGFQYWQWRGLALSVYLLLFLVTLIFREPLSILIGSVWCDSIFGASVMLTYVGIGVICHGCEETDKNALVLLVAIMWFVLWGALARSATRHSFFLGVPLAFGTAFLLWRFPIYLVQWLKDKKYFYPCIKERVVSVGILISILVPVLFWQPMGGHLRFAFQAVPLRQPTPGEGSLLNTFTWMKKHLSKNNVVATDWNLGSQLNVLGGVKTIIGPDHYIQHWIPLYYQHVSLAQSEQEALSFLKTHHATHLMLTDKEVAFHSHGYSFIGSDKNNNRQFRFHKLKKIDTKIGAPIRMVPELQVVPLVYIDIVAQNSKKVTVIAKFRNHKPVSKTFQLNTNRSTKKSVDVESGGLIFYFDRQNRLLNVYYVPQIGWSTLAVKLFMREEYSSAFVQVYPSSEDDLAEVKVWEINYPLEIERDDKYLATEPKRSRHKFRKH